MSGVLVVPFVPSRAVTGVLPMGVARRRAVILVAEVRHMFLVDVHAVMGAAMAGVVILVVIVIHLP